MGENETFSMIEPFSIKDYVSENSAIINDLTVIINNIDAFIQGDKDHKENVEKSTLNCLMEEIRNQNNDLKTVLEKAEKILNILR